MLTFKDSIGKAWSMAVTVAALERIRDMAGVDFGEPAGTSPTAVQRLRNDPVVAAAACWAVLQPQASAKGLEQAAFYERVSGKVFSAMMTAFWEGIYDFFLYARPQIATEIVESARAELKTMDGEAARPERSGKASTSSRASRASTRRR